MTTPGDAGLPAMVQRMRKARLLTHEGDISMRQIAVLALATDPNPHKRTIAAFADAMDVGKPSVSRAVSAMVKRRLLVKKVSRKDLRVVVVSITEGGARCLVAAQRAIGAIEVPA